MPKAQVKDTISRVACSVEEVSGIIPGCFSPLQRYFKEASSTGPGLGITNYSQKHVQKWALKWNRTFGQQGVAQRIASCLILGGRNQRKRTCFYYFSMASGCNHEIYIHTCALYDGHVCMYVCMPSVVGLRFDAFCTFQGLPELGLSMYVYKI